VKCPVVCAGLNCRGSQLSILQAGHLRMLSLHRLRLIEAKPQERPRWLRLPVGLP